jgi:hypothetical protein
MSVGADPHGPGSTIGLNSARFDLPTHMSNAGLKKPNRGQDFITAAIVF